MFMLWWYCNRWQIYFFFFILVMSFSQGCGYKPTSQDLNGPTLLATNAVASYQDADGPALFEEMDGNSGIIFTYKNGEEKGNLAILESLGGGVGFLDLDNDGLLDILVPCGGSFDGKKIIGEPCKLFANKGNMLFKEESKRLKLQGDWFYTHGIATADYNRDGWDDALLTGWGRLALLRNEPVDPSDPSKGRQLVDVTHQSGLLSESWSSSAAWGDLDGDGFPDLFVACYTDWSFSRKHPSCSYGTKFKDVCPPKEFKGLQHLLFLNKGDGTFREIGTDVGLEKPGQESSKGLGTIMVDLDGNGKPEIYVCNDTVENFLYLNQSTKGAIRLQSWAREGGVARDDRGNPNGSMGVDSSDYDATGKYSVWVTNYENEPHALYHNDGLQDGRPVFSWKTTSSGIAAMGQKFVSWGTGFGDFDWDGFEDLFVINGHAIRYPGGSEDGQKMPPVLLRNQSGGKFKLASHRGGTYFNSAHRGRGAALGDLDNDGALDLVVSHLNSPGAILHGIAPSGKNWIGFKVERSSHSCCVGTVARLTSTGRTICRQVKGGGSYASSSDRRLHFGLDQGKNIEKLVLNWPDGTHETFSVEKLTPGKYHTITQGKGFTTK